MDARWLLTLALAALVAAGGCGGTRPDSGQGEIEDHESNQVSDSGLQICAYVTADGVRHPYDGYVRRLDDGRYQFTPYGRARQPFTLAITEVQELVPKLEAAPRKTIGPLALGAIIVGGLAVVYLILDEFAKELAD